MPDQVDEFDCCECCRHIVSLCGDVPELPLCGSCLFMPGWFRNLELRVYIDPSHDGSDPAEPQVPA